MPIYEFKCLKCDHYLEILIMNQNEEIDLKCSRCDSKDLERIISTTNYHMANGSGSHPSASAQTRTCSSGSCTTYEIPGHSR